MKIKKITENTLDSFRRFLWKITPKYKGRSIFSKDFWQMWWDRRINGFDNSDTWSLDYTITKFIVPRLRRFIEYADNSIPTSLLKEEQQKSMDKGYEWDNQYWCLKDRKENKRCFQRAAKKWLDILNQIAEGFEDELLENEHWEDWYKKWIPTVNKVNKKLLKAKTVNEKKKIWEELKSGREYRSGNLCRIEDVVYNMRNKSKELLCQYYNALWW